MSLRSRGWLEATIRLMRLEDMLDVIQLVVLAAQAMDAVSTELTKLPMGHHNDRCVIALSG